MADPTFKYTDPNGTDHTVSFKAANQIVITLDSDSTETSVKWSAPSGSDTVDHIGAEPKRPH
jgi:hypothetical protein